MSDHDHPSEFCICWSLGTYAQLTCGGACHTRDVEDDE